MERYDSPDQSGRSAVIKFPQIGRVIVTPRLGDFRAGSWCTVELRNRTSRVVLKTLGGPNSRTETCDATSAVGRVPSPANVFRIAIIHIVSVPVDVSPDPGRLTPVIVYQTLRDPVWRVDTDLARELVAAGATDTIADIRNYLRRRKR